MSEQLELRSLPIADPEWLDHIERERAAERRAADIERLRVVVAELSDGEHELVAPLGYVSTQLVADHVHEPLERVARRLRELADRGLLDRLRGGNGEPAYWSSP